MTTQAADSPHGLPMPRSLSPSSMGTFTSCPLAFRFSLHREAARAAVGAGQQGHPRAPRAPAPHVAAGRRAHDRRRARRPRTRSRGARGRRGVLAARALRRGVGPVPRRRRGARAPLLRHGGPARDHRPGCRAVRARGDGRRRDHPRHHRPARARRRRRARDHRLQDRPRARARLGAAEPRGHAHLLAAVREDVRPPPEAHPAALPGQARADHDPAERPVGEGCRGEVGRGDEGRAHRVHPGRLPAACLGAVRVLLLPGVLPGVRR